MVTGRRLQHATRKWPRQYSLPAAQLARLQAAAVAIAYLHLGLCGSAGVICDGVETAKKNRWSTCHHCRRRKAFGVALLGPIDTKLSRFTTFRVVLSLSLSLVDNAGAAHGTPAKLKIKTRHTHKKDLARFCNLFFF